jgi:hypothetical protein
VSGMPDAGTLRHLIEHAGNGTELDLSGRPQASQEIPAEWIRNIITGVTKDPYTGKADPRGIIIRGGTVPDELDLDGVDSKVGLRLISCTLAVPLLMRDAKLPWLDLDDCTLAGIAAGRAQLSLLRIGGGQITGSCEDGLVQLDGAGVSSRLVLTARVTNASGPALAAAGLKVGDTTAGGACLDGLIAAAAGESAAAVCLSGATVNGGLSLRGAHLGNSDGPALAAEGITVQGDLLMTGTGRPFTASGTGGHGTVRLHRASISGQLSLEHALILYAAPAGDPAGAVCLSGATISGNLVLRNATLAADAGPALMAENLTIKGHAGYCEDPAQRFTATGSSEAGTVCLPGAAITGQLSLCGAYLENTSGPALMAELAAIQEDAVLTQGFTAKGVGPHGALCLREAKISGDLALHGACLANREGPALGADGLTVQGDLMMTPNTAANVPFVATGTGRRGTIRLLRASISGQLSLERAVIAHGFPDEPDPAAPGGTQRGAVCLSGATISGNLVLRRAALISAAGPALTGDYLTVKGDAGLCEAAADGLYAAGQGGLGAVCLVGATISGQLSLRGSTICNDHGPAFSAESAQIQGDAFLADGFTAVGSRYGTVRLVDASFAKALRCSGVLAQLAEKKTGTAWPALDMSRAKVGTLYLDDGFDAYHAGLLRGLLAFDGLTYTGLPKLGTQADVYPHTDEQAPTGRKARSWQASDEARNVAQWTFWFRECAGTFAAQPYQALAGAYASAGYDNLARRIMVRQRDALRANARQNQSLTPVRRASQFFSKWLIGYGYHCVAALAWLAGLFAVTAVAAVFFLGPQGYIVQVSTSTSVSASTTAAANPAQSGYRRCSTAGEINYAIGIALPIISLSNSQTACDIRPPGDWEMNLLAWVVRVLAAVLAVVYAAGLTGLTRSLPGGGS